MSNEDFHKQLLHLLTTQNETIAKILEKQNDTMEKLREEQNSRIEEQNTMMKERTMALKKPIANFTPEFMSLMQSQNDNMKEMTSAVKTLERNSSLDHDDRPFPVHNVWTHEPGWRAVFETHITKMKDQVERWRNGTDSTLIFVALFVTVITTFQAPVSQNLSPNPADRTNEILSNITTILYAISAVHGLNIPGGLPQPVSFRPDRTDQVVTLFFYIALLLSLITAFLSVIGRQWVEHLMKKPDGQSYKDKSWRLDIREKYAEKLLRPILGSLHPILIVSIALFTVGLLFQLWSISFSTGKPAVLILTSSLGSALLLGMAAVTVYTLVHGICREESPFTTSTSLGVRRRLAPRRIKTVPKVDEKTDLYPLFCSAVKQMGETHHFDQASSVAFWDLLESNDASKVELAVNTIVFVLESDASLKAKQTIAWNLCTCEWRIEDELRKKSVECHQKLYDTLKSMYRDTPPSQENALLVFNIAQLVVFLGFSGVDIRLDNLDNKGLIEVYLKIFKLDVEKCIDKIILDDVKSDAYISCTKNSRFLDDVIDNFHLLLAMVKEDGYDWWKLLILRRLTEENLNVTNVLKSISTESLKVDADQYQLSRILLNIISHRNLPLHFPDEFDISNLIKFATTDEHRFDGFGSPVDVLLSCLSLMDESLLHFQHNLHEFLESLDGHESDIYHIRHEIPLTSASIIELRARVLRRNTSTIAPYEA